MLQRISARLRGYRNKPNLAFTTLIEDGAWCWFADPRVVRYRGSRDSIYVGSVTSKGDIRIDQYESGTGLHVSAILRHDLDRNDHANPTLLLDSEGRISVFYSAHNGDAIFRRTSVRPEDVSEWLPESELVLNAGGNGRDTYTYPSPVLATEDGVVYLFWRGDGWKPTMSVSRDGGATWDSARVLVMRQDVDDSNRPYTKVSGSDNCLDLAFTDGHPMNEEFNSIYYARLSDGRFMRADGSMIAHTDELPFEPSDADRVYNAAEQGAKSWVWDVARDKNGNPVIVFSAFPADDEHVYWYARWSGSEWLQNRIVSGGGWFPQDKERRRQTEPYYSGGVVLDHDDVDVVYLSRQVKGVFEIERWMTSDLGVSWNHSSVTAESSSDNVRPVVVRNHDSVGPQVLWMHISGKYVGYKDYQTSIRMAERSI